jgi:hypothetical protein
MVTAAGRSSDYGAGMRAAPPITQAAGRAVRRLVAVAVLTGALLAGGCAGPLDPLVVLVRALPADLAEGGVLLRRGPAGHEALAAALSIPPGDVVAGATAGVPALRVLLVEGDAAAVVAALAAQGFQPVPGAEGWTVLRRPDDVPGFAGVQGVAVGPGVVAAGGLDQLGRLAAAGAPLPVPEGALADAEVALVGGPVAAVPPLPQLSAAVVSAGAEGRGQVAVRLAGAGAQADAVALSVLLRTGVPALQVGGALTAADVVTVDVTWLEDPVDVLRGGLADSPLAVLDG